ncbi:hypothetical protein ACW0JT_06420 [Arthrobacter sp. SA17]
MCMQGGPESVVSGLRLGVRDADEDEIPKPVEADQVLHQVPDTGGVIYRHVVKAGVTGGIGELNDGDSGRDAAGYFDWNGAGKNDQAVDAAGNVSYGPFIACFVAAPEHKSVTPAEALQFDAPLDLVDPSGEHAAIVIGLRESLGGVFLCFRQVQVVE